MFGPTWVSGFQSAVTFDPAAMTVTAGAGVVPPTLHAWQQSKPEHATNEHTYDIRLHQRGQVESSRDCSRKFDYLQMLHQSLVKYSVANE